MKDWNFGHYLLLVVGILILIYIISPSARKWTCGAISKFKKEGDKCSNCDTKVSGVITSDGQCVPEVQVTYDNCIQNNTSAKDGSDCVGCGSNPNGSSKEDFSGKGVIVSGQCTALPDAFAGKICVPASATVTPTAISYKRILISGTDYTYYKNDGNVISQAQSTPLDTQITKDDYIHAFVQIMKPCPPSQVKV